MAGIMGEEQEEIEDQIINEEYKIWKKNAPYLYDIAITHALIWPSLTVQWLPVNEVPPDSDYSVQKLVLGTHTSNNEQNELLIAKVRLPLPGGQVGKEYEDSGKEGTAVGFGLAKQENKVEIETRINHQGEVNRARYMPQHYNVVATKTVSSQIHVFDYFKHPTKPETDQVRPELRLLGHSKEGYGIDWNSRQEGYLLSGSDDNTICIWDIQGATAPNKALEPLLKLEEHTGVVEDVCWHKFHDKVFGSVGDDKRLMLWDIRGSKPTHSIEGHPSEILSLDMNPYNEYLVATASADKTVALWDMRNMQIKMGVFDQHQDEVTGLQWAPFNESILASSSQDRRVNVWDLSRIGQELSQVDMEDGPPELLFVHGGHTSKISDISWNLNEELVMASVAEDNIIQIWSMANEIYYDEKEVDPFAQAENIGMKDVE